MVLVDEVSPEAVIRSAKSGRCYATTGLLPEIIKAEGGHLEVGVNASCEGRFIGPGGEVLSSEANTAFAYTATDEAYVRFEAENESGRLFLQPTFRD